MNQPTHLFRPLVGGRDDEQRLVVAPLNAVQVQPAAGAAARVADAVRVVKRAIECSRRFQEFGL